MHSLSLFLAICASLTAGSTAPKHNRPTVKLSTGTIVNGIVDNNYGSVRQFLGIPFAQPPIGNLRWEAPRPNRLPRALNTSTYGRSCTQFLPTIPNIYNTDVLEYNVADVNSSGEDCLTLSLWTPQRAENLPVIVFFYGGGWYTGGQITLYQIPTQWVERTKDVIVVVPNFRGNIFGFPNAAGVKDQNLGLLDQRLAVEWVRDNIAAFGGDPHRITLWGQSSGAEAVDMYNYAWYSDPIVAGLIMDSGTAFTESVLGTGAEPRYSNFSYVAAQVGCGGSKSPQEELTCMKKVDAGAIEQVIADEANGGSQEGLAFGTSADERVVFSDYTDRALQGKLTRVPAIIGINKDDGIAFAPYNASGPDSAQSGLWFTLLFLCPTYKTASLRAAAGIPTYRYLYAGNFSNISPRPWMGAYHQSELPMLFGTHGNYRGSSTRYEVAVSEAMQDAWVAFARNPKSLATQQWPQFTPDGDAVRTFGGGNGTVAVNGVGTLKAYEDQCKSLRVRQPVVAR